MFGVSSICQYLKLSLLVGFLVGFLGRSLGDALSKDQEKIFTNGWAIRVHGGLEEAKKIAKAHGFKDVHPVSDFKTIIIFFVWFLQEADVTSSFKLVWYLSIDRFACVFDCLTLFNEDGW